MSKEFEQTSWPCYEDVKKTWIARGIDSEVWRSGDFVLKVYKNVDKTGLFVSADKLLIYQKITNLASALAISEDWTAKLPFPLGIKRVEINPYTELKKCEHCGNWEGRAPYIKGVRANLLPYSFINSNWGDTFLGSLTYKIERNFNVSGIHMIPLNIKILSSKFVITDLCDDISAIKIGR